MKTKIVGVLALGVAIAGAARAGATHNTKAHVSQEKMAPRESFDTVRDALVVRASEAEMLAEATPAMWGRDVAAANLDLQLASLTGQWKYYASAERFVTLGLDAAHKRDEDGARGPALVRAELDFALHRFVDVLSDLAPVYAEAARSGDDELLAQAKALEGATRVVLGQYERGQTTLREAIDLDPDRDAHRQRLAVALVKTGDVDQALDIFATAERSAPTERSRAWIALQRGIVEMDRGRLSVARGHLSRARQSFPGYWLVDEHLAELDALEGHTADAKVAYEALVVRTGDPEHMDALAELVRPQDPERADALEARAHAVHEERLAQFPEAAAGHAVEHWLHVERDVERAITLAEKNYSVRPDGEARTRLAQAYLRGGRLPAAAAEMRAVLATRWISTEAYATAAVIFRRVGDVVSADAAEAKAIAWNPRAMESVAWLTTR